MSWIIWSIWDFAFTCAWNAYKDDYINWLAYYNDEFNEFKDYYMWQMCSNGKIDGIDGYVDIDIMYKK